MRFYGKLLKPFPLFVFTIGFIVINPLNMPPQSSASATEIVVATPTPEPTLVARTPEDARVYAKLLMTYWDWNPSQWSCLDSLWTHESNWRPNAYNKTPVYQNGEKLHAGGIAQILGVDPSMSVEDQVSKGFEYIQSRYGNPCSAWRWWQFHYWY